MESLDNSILAWLPNEILFLIARWLPMRDRIALAMVCHFLRVFGREHFRVMPVYRIIGDREAVVRTDLRFNGKGYGDARACCSSSDTVIMRRDGGVMELSHSGDVIRRFPRIRGLGVCAFHWETREIVGDPIYARRETPIYSCKTGQIRYVQTPFTPPFFAYGGKMLFGSCNGIALFSMNDGEMLAKNTGVRMANFDIACAHDRKGKRIFVNCGFHLDEFRAFDEDTLELLGVFTVLGMAVTYRVRGCDIDDAGQLAILHWDPVQICVYRMEGLTFVHTRTIALSLHAPPLTSVLAFRIGRDGDMTCVFPDRMLVISTR